MQSRRDSGEHGTALGTGFITNGDDVGEGFASFDEVQDCFGLVLRNIDANLLHCLHDNGIQLAGFQSRAFHIKFIAANIFKKCLGHLASRTVVNANKEHSFFHEFVFDEAAEQQSDSRKAQHAGTDRIAPTTGAAK